MKWSLRYWNAIVRPIENGRFSAILAGSKTKIHRILIRELPNLQIQFFEDALGKFRMTNMMGCHWNGT